MGRAAGSAAVAAAAGALAVAAGGARVAAAAPALPPLVLGARAQACAGWDAAAPASCAWWGDEPAGDTLLAGVDASSGAATQVAGPGAEVAKSVAMIGEAGAHACGDDLAVFYALWRVGHPQSQLVPALVAVTAGGEVGVVPGGEPGGMLPEAELPQWAVSTAGDGGGCRLLAWSRVKMEPSGNVSETLWSTTVPPVSSGRNASTEVLFATGGGGGGGVAARAPRRAAAAARGAAPQGLGYSHALDAAGGLLYAQDGTGDIAVFDVSSKAFKDPLPAGGAERACLHYDPATKRLGALVRGSAAGSWALASVDAATGAVAQRLALPPLGGLVPYSVRDGGPPTCSFSAATGTLAVQLERVDANATYAYARGVEVAVLPVDTRTPAAAASVAVAYDFGKPAAPNATWRMVDPVLSLVG